MSVVLSPLATIVRASVAVFPPLPSPPTDRFVCVRLPRSLVDSTLPTPSRSKLSCTCLTSFGSVRNPVAVYASFDKKKRGPDVGSEEGESGPGLSDFWTPEYLGNPDDPEGGVDEPVPVEETPSVDHVGGGKKVEERDGFVKVGWRWKRKKINDGMEESVVEVRRVSKMAAGGRRFRYRVVMAVGNKRGKVGVGVGKALDISDAVQKGAINARKYMVEIPLTHHLSFPQRTAAKYKAAIVMLRPGCAMTGLRAGGVVRQLLDMAGVRNAVAKQFGSRNRLNNARAVLLSINKMRYFQEHAIACGVPRYKVFKNMLDPAALP